MGLFRKSKAVENEPIDAKSPQEISGGNLYNNYIERQVRKQIALDNLNTRIEFTYSTNTTYDRAYLNFMYEGNTTDTTNWQFSAVTIWYVSSASSRIVDPFYIVQRGADNEN